MPPATGEGTAGMAARGWVGTALDGAVMPIGAGLAIGLGAARVITPEWVVGGAPLVAAYPKNVELEAATLGTIGAGLAAAAAAWRPGRAVAVVLAAVGYALLAVSAPRALPIGLPVLGLAAALAVALDGVISRPATSLAADRPAAARAWLVVIGVLLFALCSTPITIDVYHHGEVLLSARDLLAGGRPFVTYQWMHGATDSVVAALWMLLTGKSGSSPMALMIATNIALGVAACYLLARRAVGGALATMVGVGLLAVVAAFGSQLYLLLGLRSAGMMVFLGVAVGVIASPAWRGLLAGMAIALAHVYRIDAGLFGALALAAVVAVQSLCAAPTWPGRAVAALRGGMAVAAGAGLALGGLRILLGWPDAAWFAYVLGPLPRLHAICNGLPYPWPGQAAPLLGAAGAVALALPAILLAAAVRAGLRAVRHDGVPVDAARLELLTFLAVFALAAMHTALGRSDMPHLLHWTLPVLFATGLLCAADWLRRVAVPPRRAHVILAVVSAALAADVLLDRRHLPRQLLEHLRPNPPVGACADTRFTPLEARGKTNARFIDATCATRRILAEHGVTRLVIDDGAPWYFEQFGMPLPSPYYAWYLARTPADQQAAIADMRRLQAQAVLQPRDFGAVEVYDVPTAHLAPIVAAYLRGRSDGAPAVDTPIGRLVLWNAPPAPPGEAWRGPFDATLAAAFDGAVYDPVTRFLDATGWAFDPTAAAPLAALSLIQPPRIAGADLRTGIERRDVEALLGTHAARGTGWRFVTRLAPGGWRDPALGLLLVGGDGRQRFAPIEAMPVRELPRRAGAMWDDLSARVDAAEALGRADRAAALASATD